MPEQPETFARRIAGHSRCGHTGRTLYAFVTDRSFARSTETLSKFETLTSEIDGGFLLHFAVDPTKLDSLFAAGRGRVLVSDDNGRT